MSAIHSLRGQLAVTAVAAISLLALTAILVHDVVVGAEQRIVAEAQQQCQTAAEELAQQYRVRLAFRDDTSLETLPLEAQELSLKALAATVLRAYDGLQGGFLQSGRVVGRAGSTGGEDLPPMSRAETDLVLSRLRSGESARIDDRADILVAAAVAAESGSIHAWALKRLTNVGSAVPSQRTWLLGGLALSALLGFGALLSISLQLRRGVENLHDGLERLESDLSYRLPILSGDLGDVAEAINKMASARDTLEQHMRQQERLAALGRVVGGVAHEIRNPLNSLRLTLELLNRRVQRQEGETAPIDAAVAEVDRLDGILTKLLAFGRPGADERERQKLEPTIRRAVGMAEERATRRNISIALDLDQVRQSEAEVDASQIEQVLLNLLLNAVEASPDGARIEVAVRNGDRDIAIEVIDHGTGIDPEVRQKIFDPYFTTKDTGSGLGLAISREILRRHGGDLSFESEPGKTAFRASLPASGREGRE
jgi:signal transduction histidine kinase